MSDLEHRLNVICDSLAVAQKEFEQGAECCVQAIHGMHERMERIEKWIESQQDSLKFIGK